MFLEKNPSSTYLSIGIDGESMENQMFSTQNDEQLNVFGRIS